MKYRYLLHSLFLFICITDQNEGYGNIGMSDFGKGIFAYDNSTRYREVDASSAKGKHDILVPIFECSQGRNTSFAMFNIYSEQRRAAAVDYLLANCSKTACAAVTDFVDDVSSSYSEDQEQVPSTLMMYPIITSDNKGKKMTGIVAGAYSWASILYDSVPLSAKGLEASIRSSSGETVYFKFDSGNAIRMDASTVDMDNHFKQEMLVEFGDMSYAISLAKTSEFVSQYRTWGPLIACILSVSISLFTSFIFTLYDMVMNRQSREKDIIMETKRLFVRYISHEIRTPLNTVHLGLQVLREEMLSLLDNIENIDQVKSCMIEWTDFMSEIDNSTEDAITVVSDLLDFDKLSTGMLSMESAVHDIWKLVNDTVLPFHVQAKSRNVILIADLSPNIERASRVIDLDADVEVAKILEDERTSQLVVFGDNIKIQQIIRNLISNALKFSKQQGEVTVSGNQFHSSSFLLLPSVYPFIYLNKSVCY